MATIVTIPATRNRFTEAPIHAPTKRRVAGYARVSTDNAEQLTSYETQVKYYTKYIKSRSDWEFAGMYTDEGISGTNTKHREGFNQMIADALAGKIDLIITKSVSRFAKNTVDSLTTVRKLKEKGIEIYFEKENIWTLDSKGELLITIMSSLAQEESRSISENVTWGQRKRFAEGKVSMPYKHFLGYDKGPGGKLVVNPEQAEIVKMIFRMFLRGMTPHRIAAELTKRGIKSPAGKSLWHEQVVKRILKNEKYKGDALLQKSYTVDFLTKKKKKNEGEIPQYYVKDDHEAIIRPEIFDLVQAEMKRRLDGSSGRYSGVSIFASKVKCGNCGCWYGAKVWHSTDKYRRIVYRCNGKYKGPKCNTPGVSEEDIKAIFVSAVNKLLAKKGDVVENIRELIDQLCDTGEIENELKMTEDEMNKLAAESERFVSINSQVAIDQAEYNRAYLKLAGQYENAQNRYNELTGKIQQKEQRRKVLAQFVKTVESTNPVTEFDPVLWASLLDYITVCSKDDIRVRFKDGTVIKM